MLASSETDANEVYPYQPLVTQEPVSSATVPHFQSPPLPKEDATLAPGKSTFDTIITI
jgi:hypothetical protein